MRRHECPRRLHGGRLGDPRELVTEIGGRLPSAVAVFRQALADHAVERRRRERRHVTEGRGSRSRIAPMMLAWLPASKARLPATIS